MVVATVVIFGEMKQIKGECNISGQGITKTFNTYTECYNFADKYRDKNMQSYFKTECSNNCMATASAAASAAWATGKLAQFANERAPVDQVTLQKYISTKCKTYEYIDDNAHGYQGDLNNPDPQKTQSNDCQNIVTIAKVAAEQIYPKSNYAVDKLFSRWKQCAQVYYQGYLWTFKGIRDSLEKNPHQKVFDIESGGWPYYDKINPNSRSSVLEKWEKIWKPNPNNYPYQFAPYNTKTTVKLDPAKQSKHFLECLALPNKDQKNNDIIHIDDIMKANVQEDIKELSAAKK